MPGADVSLLRAGGRGEQELCQVLTLYPTSPRAGGEETRWQLCASREAVRKQEP